MERRFSSIRAFCFFIIVVSLTSCSFDSRPLSPTQVFSRAAQYNKQLSSVSFDVLGSILIHDEDGDVQYDGDAELLLKRDDLQQLHARFSLLPQSKALSAMYGDVEFFLSPLEQFVYVHELGGTEVSGWNDAYAHSWWQLPTVSSIATHSLNLMNVLDVEVDRGLQQGTDNPYYQYVVVFKPTWLREVLQQRDDDFLGLGQIWIDATTFAITKIAWDIERMYVSENVVLSGTIEAVLRDHNNVSPLSPPVSAVKLPPLQGFSLPFVHSSVF